jgi:hypothetical protein
MNRFLNAFILITMFAFMGFAQGSNTGSLTGTITDASGVIPGAMVVVKDNQTGKERSTVTTSDGAFNFAQLEVGLYTVTVTSAGHKTRSYTDVKLDVGQTYTLTANLEAGDIAEVVTVTGGADIVNSANGEISTTVTTRQIVELPLNGRNPLSLVLLQAGTSSNAVNSTTINGQRSTFTNITRDGVNVQDNFIRTNAVDFLPDRPNVDDTGEFTIVTQNAGADLGYGASQVQLVTPRGSSQFHGALYEYNRNSKFTANTFFNNFNNVPRTYLNRNQFGGKIGGPLPLPRFGEGGPAFYKNKGFFFVAYEKFILHQSTTPTRTILLPNARNGIFTFQDLGGAIRTVNIFTLAANAGLPGAPTGIDPTVASRIIANLPTTGNSAAVGDQFNTTGLVLPITSNQARDGFTSRYDVDANAKNSFNLVVNYKHEYLQRTDLNAQQGGTACCYSTTPIGFQDAHTPFVVGAWRWTPSASLTNELRAGIQKSNPIFGITNTQPAFYLQVPLINNPEIGFDPQGRYTVIENFQDNAVWAKGNHVIKFGGSYDIYNANPFGPGAFGQSYIPTYVIGGGVTPQFTQASINAAMGCVSATGANCIASGNVGTANSLLALLGGMIGGANQTFNAASQTGSLQPVAPNRNVNYKHIGPYIADQWKITPNFTLNYGLRYELYTPVEEPNGLAIEAVFGNKAPIDALLDPNGTYNFVGTNVGGHKFFKADKNNFAPVVSFAWSPNFKSGILNDIFPGEGKTVLRGGYRISYVNDNFVRAADNALIGNAGLTSTLSVPNGFGSGSINARLTSLPSFTAPGLVVPRTYAQNNALAGNFGTVFGIDPGLQAPSLQEFNVGIERELGFDTALEVRYVHNRSNNLVRGLDLNQINILSNGFLADFNRARSNLTNYGTGGINCVVDATHPACQPLQILNTAALAGPGALTNSTIRTDIQTGIPADLALFYIQNGLGSSLFLKNPNTGVVDWLTNSAKSRYNALQMEVRRRFNRGFTFQANYTFQKSLTDAPGTGQTAFEPLIDNGDPTQEYGIADSDTTHVFNLNTIYELPFGKGKPFFKNANSWVDRVIGGWQLTSIIRWSTGTPFTVTDPRGVFNRAGRSGRQEAFTTLSKDQLKKAAGVFRTACGVYFIDPQYINLDMAQCANGLVRPRVAGTTAGVASLGYNPLTCTATACTQAVQTFPGQVFFNLAPGQKGNTGVNRLAGPMYLNWDASIIKKIPINERWRLEIRAEAFNVLNRANFANGSNQASINSSTFGRLSGTFQQRIVQFVGRIEF